MIYIFVGLVLCIGVLFLVSKNKYAFLSDLGKEQQLKFLMPAGLFLLELLGWRFNTQYDRIIEANFNELLGAGKERQNLKIHWAVKMAYILATLVICGFFAVMVEEVDSTFMFFCLVALVLAFYLPDKELKDKVGRRRLRIQMEFPDFLNKLVLLVNAGMNTTSAIHKIALDWNVGTDKKDGSFYKELHTTAIEIKAGKSEVKAFEDLAKRCRMQEITKFTSVLIQNLRKGNSEMVSILRLQAVECWELRKNVAKRLGEEAETKLLFPMMLMFLAILIIVIAPSVMQLQGF